MSYPTLQEVKEASDYEIMRWIRALQAPANEDEMNVVQALVDAESKIDPLDRDRIQKALNWEKIEGPITEQQLIDGYGKAEQPPWEKMTQRQADPAIVDAMNVAAGVKDGSILDEVWANDEYMVYVRYMDPPRLRAGMLHLSIKRHDRRPVGDWRDIQAIKNDVCGREREGCELYPAESRLVDQANQTHLWVLGAGERLPIGFPERVVKTEDEARAEMADIVATLDVEDSGKQRAWRPGISTGPDYR